MDEIKGSLCFFKMKRCTKLSSLQLNGISVGEDNEKTSLVRC